MEEFISRLVQTSVSQRLGIISTFAILIPLAFGLASYRTGGRLLRLFFFFLLLGFFTDLLGAYAVLYRITDGFQFHFIAFVYNKVYPPLEALFLFWVIGLVTTQKNIKRTSHICMVVSVLVWILLTWLIPDLSLTYLIFYFIREIIVWFLASMLLLETTEKDASLIALPEFWLLLALYLSGFYGFYLTIIYEMAPINQFWFMYNLVNLLTYVLYAIGFFAHIKQQRKVVICQR